MVAFFPLHILGPLAARPCPPPPAARSQRYSHDGAALGLVLAEGGGEQRRLAGQVQEPLGEAADRAGFIGRLEFVHAGHRRSTENAVDALL